MTNQERPPLQVIFRTIVAVLLLLCPVLQSYAQERVTVENGITYGKGGDVDLKLNLARPSQGNGPYPGLVFIHGGGWMQDTRAEFDYAIKQAAEKGYVAVTVDYRLTNDETKNGKPKYPFPAQLYDVKSAVRWLRANSKKFKIDTDHIGALGSSAGAHLALLLGLTDYSDGLEGETESNAYSSGVQAVVNLAGPTELAICPPADAYILGRLLGGTPEEVPENYKKASPLTYVRKNSPPILTINGDTDEAVPLQQAELLDGKMKEVGACHILIVKKNTGHDVSYNEKKVWQFLDKELKPSWLTRLLRSLRLYRL